MLISARRENSTTLFVRVHAEHGGNLTLRVRSPEFGALKANIVCT